MKTLSNLKPHERPAGTPRSPPIPGLFRLRVFGSSFLVNVDAEYRSIVNVHISILNRTTAAKDTFPRLWPYRIRTDRFPRSSSVSFPNSLKAGPTDSALTTLLKRPDVDSTLVTRAANSYPALPGPSKSSTTTTSYTSISTIGLYSVVDRYPHRLITIATKNVLNI